MNEEQNQEIVVASFFERAVAFVIDIAFLNLLILIFLFALIKFNLIISQKSLNLFTGASYLLMFLYFVYFTVKGKTLGKFLVGIEVLNKNGRDNLTFKQSFLRNIGYIIDLFTVFGGFLLGLFNTKRRTLHDFLGSSIVISTRQKSPWEEIAFSILGTIIIGAVILFAYYIFFLAPKPFDTKRIALATEQLERLAYLEEVHRANFGYYTDDLRRLSLISGDGVQLNRDLQKAFKRKGFKIGLTKDKNSYRIEGYAKDTNESLVFKEKTL